MINGGVGTKETQYSLNNGTDWYSFEGTEKTITLSGDGEYNIIAKSKDYAENESELTESLTIIIGNDSTNPNSPTIKLISTGDSNAETIMENGETYTYNESFKIKIVGGEDNESGVKVNEYVIKDESGNSIDSGSFSDSEEYTTALMENPGKYTISTRTIDNAGNESNLEINVTIKIYNPKPTNPKIQTYTGYRDKNTGEIAFSPVSAWCKDENGNSAQGYVEKWKLEIIAGEDTDVKKTTYSVSYKLNEDAEYKRILEGEFTGSKKIIEIVKSATYPDGQYLITATTTDEENQVSMSIMILKIKEEITPPNKPTIEVISGTLNPSGDGTYISADVRITPGEDNEGGVGIEAFSYTGNYIFDYSMEYSLDGGITWVNNDTYSGEGIVEKWLYSEGTYTIMARTYDRLGNVSEVAELTVTIKN